MDVIINYWAVIVAAVASMMIGFMWYEPLFGKQWIALSNITPEDMERAKEKGMGKTYFGAFIGSLIMAYVLALFVSWLGIATASGALIFAFWAWLGLIATVMLNTLLWEGKPVKLYMINIVHQLVNVGVMSVIVALWR